VTHAQAPDTLWTKTYGGSGADQGISVQQTSDGGYIITGTTYSFGASGLNVYLIKTDSFGDTMWTKTYGGTDYDYGHSVQQTSDGGYIIVGGTHSFGAGSGDVYLVKVDLSGDTTWTKNYGGTALDWGRLVQQTSDEGYIIAGTTESFGAGGYDVYLIKTDSLGDTLWSKTYGGGADDCGCEVQQTSDGGYIIAGYTSSFGAGSADVYLVKVDLSGDTIWTKTYGGTNMDRGFSVQETSDDGYIIAGTTVSFGAGAFDVYLIKTTSFGDTMWTKTYGGTNWDEGRSVQQTSDDGYIITGYISSFGAGDTNVYLLKTDTEGDTLWTKTCGGAGIDIGNGVKQTTDNGYVIVGYTSSFGAGSYDVYLIKTGPEQGVTEHVAISISNDQITATVFQGPLQLPLDKKCKVFDITGRVVIPETMKPGVYFIEIDGVVTQKVIKIK
jgi:hypothetical protein